MKSKTTAPGRKQAENQPPTAIIRLDHDKCWLASHNGAVDVRYTAEGNVASISLFFDGKRLRFPDAAKPPM